MWKFVTGNAIAIIALLISALSFYHSSQTDRRASEVRVNEKMMQGYGLCQQLLFQSQKLNAIRDTYRLNVPKQAAGLFRDAKPAEELEKGARECSNFFMPAHGASEYSLSAEAEIEKLIAKLKIVLEDTARENENLERLIPHLKPETGGK